MSIRGRPHPPGFEQLRGHHHHFRRYTMRRPLLFAVGAALFSAVALAQAHIPARYSGVFPSDGVRKNITGTFTGKALSLRFVVFAKGREIQRTGTYSCTTASPTQTRCRGTYQGGGETGRQAVLITWSGGRPVATVFGHAAK
jgi:hypothetical protein